MADRKNRAASAELSCPTAPKVDSARGSDDGFHDAKEDVILSDQDLLTIRDELVYIARRVGRLIVTAVPSVDSSSTKRNSSDRVTETDKAVEATVEAYLARRFPRIAFLGEESYKHGDKLTDQPTFVVDPIDGTLNFIHQFENVAISLALVIGKKPVVGVVLNPFRHELYAAVRGHGATLTRGDPDGGNTSPAIPLPLCRPADPLPGLNGCLVAVEWGNERQGPHWALRAGMVRQLLTARAEGGTMCHSIRSTGSAALDFCAVAQGALDLFWEGGCWCWDVAAGWIILEEAGGLVASANPADWQPTLEGRVYLAVRPAPTGQVALVEEMWALMGDRRFDFSTPAPAAE